MNDEIPADKRTAIKQKKQQYSRKSATTSRRTGKCKRLCFSTEIHIRQNDIGGSCKRGRIQNRKTVRFPTWTLQIVRNLGRDVEPKSGKPCGKCGIPHQKKALKLDFWTFSTEFSTCGKNRDVLRSVYHNFCWKLSRPAKRRNLYFDGYEKDLPGEDNPADTESQQVMNSVWKLCRSGNKKVFFAGKGRQLMLYFNMSYQQCS